MFELKIPSISGASIGVSGSGIYPSPGNETKTEATNNVFVRHEWFAEDRKAMNKLCKALERLGVDYTIDYNTGYGYDIIAVIYGEPVDPEA